MTQLQMELLLRVAMHYVGIDIRERLAAEVPEAYAAYCTMQWTETSAAVAEHARIKAERSK